MTQLTVTLPDDLAQQAEAYAQTQGKSLSIILEEYLQQLVPTTFATLPELPPELARLRGVIQLLPDTDYKVIVADELQKRFEQ